MERVGTNQLGTIILVHCRLGSRLICITIHRKYKVVHRTSSCCQTKHCFLSLFELIKTKAREIRHVWWIALCPGEVWLSTKYEIFVVSKKITKVNYRVKIQRASIQSSKWWTKSAHAAGTGAVFVPYLGFQCILMHNLSWCQFETLDKRKHYARQWIESCKISLIWSNKSSSFRPISRIGIEMVLSIIIS